MSECRKTAMDIVVQTFPDGSELLRRNTGQLLGGWIPESRPDPEAPWVEPMVLAYLREKMG